MSRVNAVFAALSVVAAMGWGSPAVSQNIFDRAVQGVTGAASAVGETIAEKVKPETGAEIDTHVDATLERLFAEEPETKALADQSVAMLVFPRIAKGGFMVGGQYGEGAMREHGVTTGYYNIAGVSYGLQIGGQTFSYVMFFLNDAALQFFRDNGGWEAGVGPTLVGGDQGWSKSMGTNNLQGDIVPVFFGQAGLMAGGGLQGTKITRIDR